MRHEHAAAVSVYRQLVDDPRFSDGPLGEAQSWRLDALTGLAWLHFQLGALEGADATLQRVYPALASHHKRVTDKWSPDGDIRGPLARCATRQRPCEPVALRWGS